MEKAPSSCGWEVFFPQPLGPSQHRPCQLVSARGWLSSWHRPLGAVPQPHTAWARGRVVPQWVLLKGSGIFTAVPAYRVGFELQMQVLRLTTADHPWLYDMRARNCLGGRPFCSSAYDYSLTVFWISNVWLLSYWIKTCFLGRGKRAVFCECVFCFLFVSLAWQTW